MLFAIFIKYHQDRLKCLTIYGSNIQISRFVKAQITSLKQFLNFINHLFRQKFMVRSIKRKHSDRFTLLY